MIDSITISNKSVLYDSLGLIKTYENGDSILPADASRLTYSMAKNIAKNFQFENCQGKVSKSGLEEDEFLFSILEYLTGRKPGSEIWNTFEE